MWFFIRRKRKGTASNRGNVKFYNIPVKEIADIKQGADFITPEGIIIPNNRLTRAAIRLPGMLIVLTQSIKIN